VWLPAARNYNPFNIKKGVTMKDIIKLLVAFWLAKKLLVDNDLVTTISDKIRSVLKDFLK